MRFNKYIIISFILIWNISFACDCPQLKRETMVEKGITNSDIVFLGQIINTDSIKRTYTFKIYEVFKGKVEKNIIEGKEFGNCSIFPKIGDLWIVYSNYYEKNYVNLNICEPSQSLEYGHGFKIPPPPRPKLIDDKNILALYIGLDIQEYKNESLKSFIFQLIKLRQYKLAQNTITNENELDYKNKIIIISLMVNMLLLLSLLLLIFIRKNSRKRVVK